MKEIFSGQCLCGSVSYVSSAVPKFSLMCQCRQCQKITGAGHSAQFAVDATRTKIIGEVQSYTMKADSGNDVTSVFCGNCGNPIYKMTSMMPDTFVFHAATLDDPSSFKPQMVVYSDSAQPWDCIDPAIERK